MPDIVESDLSLFIFSVCSHILDGGTCPLPQTLALSYTTTICSALEYDLKGGKNPLYDSVSQREQSLNESQPVPTV